VTATTRGKGVRAARGPAVRAARDAAL